MPLAGAVRRRFTRWREHVIVHADHHRDEHDRVIEQVQFYTRENQLQEAYGHRGMKPILVSERLILQYSVLNVMPELNHQRNCPPCAGCSCEPLAQHPNSDQHDQRVGVVENFSLKHPWVKISEQSKRLGPGPVEHPNLISLNDVFCPVAKHNDHKYLKGTFMPAGVQFFVQTEFVSSANRTVADAWVRSSRRYPLLNLAYLQRKSLGSR